MVHYGSAPRAPARCPGEPGEHIHIAGCPRQQIACEIYMLQLGHGDYKWLHGPVRLVRNWTGLEVSVHAYMLHPAQAGHRWAQRYRPSEENGKQRGFEFDQHLPSPVFAIGPIVPHELHSTLWIVGPY